jgi:hypothetical protein
VRNLYGVIEEGIHSQMYISTNSAQDVYTQHSRSQKADLSSLDMVPKEQLIRNSDVPGPAKIKYFCLHCGKPGKIEVLALSKCSACKQVYIIAPKNAKELAGKIIESHARGYN